MTRGMRGSRESAHRGNEINHIPFGTPKSIKSIGPETFDFILLDRWIYENEKRGGTRRSPQKKGKKRVKKGS